MNEDEGRALEPLDTEAGVPPALMAVYDGLPNEVVAAVEYERGAIISDMLDHLRTIRDKLAPSGAFKAWVEAAGMSYSGVMSRLSRLTKPPILTTQTSPLLEEARVPIVDVDEVLAYYRREFALQRPTDELEADSWERFADSYGAFGLRAHRALYFALFLFCMRERHGEESDYAEQAQGIVNDDWFYLWKITERTERATAQAIAYWQRVLDHAAAWGLDTEETRDDFQRQAVEPVRFMVNTDIIEAITYERAMLLANEGAWAWLCLVEPTFEEDMKRRQAGEKASSRAPRGSVVH